MGQWCSGLVPYAVLLPVQLSMLMLMAVVNSDHSRRGGRFYALSRRGRRCVRLIAVAYFLAMVVRLGLHVSFHPGGWRPAGTIPVFTHWLLAAYLLLVAMPTGPAVRGASAGDDSGAGSPWAHMGRRRPRPNRELATAAGAPAIPGIPTRASPATAESTNPA